ncbi:MAG: hypothetical protein HC920_08345 [Oscillatoriales cyanobacterium SM2_3_0]|nr:hypothetical protein [Oscillatoriales cyanobacterium SM2_3_0]
MSKQHNRQSHLSDAPLPLPNSEPSNPRASDPRTSNSKRLSTRKSRTDRLKELRNLLNHENHGLQDQPEPLTDPQDSQASAPTLIQAEFVPAPLSKLVKPLPIKLIKRLAPLWVALLVVTPAGIGYLASNLLLKSPSLPNCPKIFWPVASASLRLYCAEIAANKQTADDLLSAIQLVDALPKDHPLRPEINRQIEQWSMDILIISEELFQAGDLSGAVQGARKIPQGTPAYDQVEAQVKAWEDLWKKAEAIYQKVENRLRREETTLAFRESTQLLNLGNQYWETTQYRKLTDLIQITREESAKLVAAKDLADQGGGREPGQGDRQGPRDRSKKLSA